MEQTFALLGFELWRSCDLVLTVHFQQLEKEKQDWGDAYQDHGLAFCREDGRPTYPDTITEEFNRLVDFPGIAEDSVVSSRLGQPARGDDIE